MADRYQPHTQTHVYTCIYIHTHTHTHTYMHRDYIQMLNHSHCYDMHVKKHYGKCQKTYRYMHI